jgi:MoaA/NifB/PqqE/SkfB family radical SAM enzyme
MIADSSTAAELPTDYFALLRALQRRAGAVRQPASGAFELTDRCNLSCQMCYIRHPANNAARRQKELSASEWLALAQDAVDNGMVFLLLTGGEVFVRPDFFEIYSPLTRMGLILTLFTNGTLVTDRIAERLAEAPPGLTQITIYGATAATYEAVTGVPGSYARCCAGIEALLKQRIPFDLRTTITQQNFGELEAMRQMAHNWGLPFSGAWMLMQRRDGNPSNVDNCRLSAQDCVSLEAADRASADEWIETASRDLSARSDSIFNCQAGRSMFVANSVGEMNLCVNLSKPAARPLNIILRTLRPRPEAHSVNEVHSRKFAHLIAVLQPIEATCRRQIPSVAG